MNSRKEVVAPPRYTKSRPVLAQCNKLSRGLGVGVVYRRSGAVPLGRAVSEGRSERSGPTRKVKRNHVKGEIWRNRCVVPGDMSETAMHECSTLGSCKQSAVASSRA
jgi:hypothetical protein